MVVAAAIITTLLLTKCKQHKTDLTEEYSVGPAFYTIPTQLQIMSYIKVEDPRTENMGSDDFDWSWSADNTQVKLTVKGSNKDYKGTITVNYSVSALFIDSSVSQDYIIENDTAISTNTTTTLSSHNKLLDLKAYADSQNYTGNNFVINSNVGFGIMVGFSQDINLYCNSGCSINLENQTVNTYGIIVGSKEPADSKDFYTGNLNIDSSVVVNISAAAANAYGVYFNSTAVGSTQTINGTFMVSTAFSVALSAFGVYFIGNAAGSVTINGTFTVSSSYAYGVRFTSTATSSTQTINGTFTVSASGSPSSAYGVYFSSTAAGSVTINGTFTVSSSTTTYASVYGVYFNSTAVGSTQTINGTFTVSATTSSSIHGIYFFDSAAGSVTINGTFTVSNDSAGGSSAAYGIQFRITQTVTCNFESNNQFTLISNNSVYSCNIDLGSKTGSNRMNVYGNQAADSVTNSSNYANYTPNNTIFLVTEGIDSWEDLKYEVHQSPTVYFFMYFASVTTGDGSTQARMKLALEHYISQPYAPAVGKGWIEEILTAPNW